jgi:hypothetical protein
MPRGVRDRWSSPIPVVQCPNGDRLVFFKVVRWNPEMVVRTKTENATGFSGDSIAVSPLRVVKYSADDGSVVVETESIQINGKLESQNLVMNLTSFSFDTLRSMRVYKPSGLSYHLRDPGDLMLGMDDWDVLPSLLKHQLESHSEGGALLRYAQDSPESRVLRALVDAGISVDVNGKFSLVLPSTVMSCFCLDNAGVAECARDDTSIDESNVWELVLYLTADNWEHNFAERVDRPAAFDPSEPIKIWYTRKSDRRINKLYLLALAHGKAIVVHFAKSAVYKSILGKPAQKKKALGFRAGVLEDDMDPGAKKPKATPLEPARKKPRVHVFPDGESDLDHGSADCEDEEDSAADDDAGCGSPGGSGGPAKSSGSSSSTSSSTSSSSTSTASAAAKELDIDVPALVSRPEKSLASESSRLKRGFDWGFFTLAPVYNKKGLGLQTAWGATCPFHCDSDTKATVCKKQIGIGKQFDAEEGLRRIKMWCLRGHEIDVELPDARTQHRKLDVLRCDVWSAEEIEAMDH